jgi:hypothetical protein
MKRLPIIAFLLGAALSARAAPIDYTFDLTALAGPAGTLLISANEDSNVQIQLSALTGNVQIDAAGAGVLSSTGDELDIEGGDRLIITPIPGSFIGPYTLISVQFGNVDTGPGNSGDQAVPYVDGVAGSPFNLAPFPGAYSPNAAFNTNVAFENSDGNDDFRISQIIINGAAAASAIPEPSAWTLLGLGVVGLAVIRWASRKSSAV